MNKYYMLPLDSEYSKDELIRRYNDAVEMIWHLQKKFHDLDKDYDALMAAYEDVSSQLYG